MQRISIIGSTGSIGQQTLDIVRQRKEDFKVVNLSAGKNLNLLLKQIQEFQPEYASIEEGQEELQTNFPDLKILKDSIEASNLDDIDIAIIAAVGIAGLKPTINALSKARRVAIANKETLVIAKNITQNLIRKFSSELIPIDSEHVAIHQCLQNQESNAIASIYLTSSGGPFRTMPLESFEQIQIQDALKHPTWSMGKKITIDSSTLMNKGLEVIELNSLFDIDYSKIQVVIHPQSIIHSAVNFVDGNSLAQMSLPDMRIPIQYALDYPRRQRIILEKQFDIFEYQQLEFFRPDYTKFPALALAIEAGRSGASMPVALNAANEIAVDLFLKGLIKYLDIPKIIEKELSRHKKIQDPSLDEILAIHEDIISRYNVLV